MHHDSVFHRVCGFGQNNFSAFVFSAAAERGRLRGRREKLRAFRLIP
ncbi:hypothetical protein HMPREF3038_00493 [Akkermansia sp. KLE1797]|nr:hypothetical protein HMPREF3038_00493 [Akkermansia sp. KLE1797]KXU55589.1 hypothetical protein HMPREF3039_00146 [Akkermansia sp. KLE1798]KZA05480.1 hypothetical protein HMPREF1326_00887 [Akkermansia sp. KLE1605]